MHIEQGLSLYNRYLVGICVERVNMQFVFSCLKINIAERFKTADGELGEFHEYAVVAGESLKVGMTLTIKIGTHLFDLKIGHIAKALGKGAFVISLAAESESFNQAAARQRLRRRADQFRKTKVVCENTYYVRAAGRPNQRFILLSLYGALFINGEKLRVKRPLIKSEGQFADNNICVRNFHLKPI